MGEFEVHRARLFSFVPSGVRCLAFAGPPLLPSGPRLALARLDGTLELCHLQANAFRDKVIPGHGTQVPEALCWVAGGRLFGAGLSGDIFEYDLQKLCIKYSLDAFGGALWSMEAHPNGTQLAVGCDDGSIKLFVVLPDRIQFERQLDRQKGQILSLSWHPSGTKIAAGSLDIIHVFDVESGHCTQQIHVERRLQAPQGQSCVVWGLAFLSDGTVVSADSAGKVQFWDSEMGTLLSKHPVSKAAALCVAVSEAGDSLVVGTSEGTVLQFQLLPVRLGHTELQWVRTRQFHHHTHDVRTVAHSATAFFSGGLDGQLVIRPLMEKVEFKSYEAALRKITFPHRCLVSFARKPRLLLFQYPQHLELWRLGATDATGKAGDVLPVSRPPEHLLQLKAKGPEHIGSSCLSPCGGWIAYSSASRFCLHRVRIENGQVVLQRVPNVPKLLCSAHCLLFSADSTRLFVGSDRGCVHVLKLLKSKNSCKHLHTLRPNTETAEAVYLLATSADGKWLAAASGDREINAYSLEEAKLHCTVPAYDCPASALAIHPLTNNLVIAHSDQQLFEFSLASREYTPWSRKVQQSGLHRDWLERDTPITHLAFSPRQDGLLLLHDTYMFCIIDKALPLPSEASVLGNQLSLSQLPRAAQRSASHAFKVCKKYQPLLFVDFLGDDSLVVVERSITDLKAQLPPPVYQKKFGT
ncbi:U3 small nucleolar RNA-associated protein 4 homolog [Anolis carolinensis]|uniref:U3 small nucleolar RNA-associated protein 4 homolog n=1 Tax=Anolis carolinensis TaxID=28377 RepID=UPI000462D3F2|nr:PREDICTED: U3 small nucleolar RNA-associated protein 4 homolog [Anolis carolinensis]|eukprot:XP_008121670.1 PREDICTED: U3 small nucleolar RNA-associated protein 4 homolog [Anolis carolinensis]